MPAIPLTKQSPLRPPAALPQSSRTFHHQRLCGGHCPVTTICCVKGVLLFHKIWGENVCEVSQHVCPADSCYLSQLTFNSSKNKVGELLNVLPSWKQLFTEQDKDFRIYFQDIFEVKKDFSLNKFLSKFYFLIYTKDPLT